MLWKVFIYFMIYLLFCLNLLYYILYYVILCYITLPYVTMFSYAVFCCIMFLLCVLICCIIWFDLIRCVSRLYDYII